MRVYVSAKFDQKSLVRDAYKKLRAAGHTITHEWVDEDASTITPNQRDEYLARCAEFAIEGVQEAEVMVLFAHPQSRGAYVELGAALGAAIPVICVAEEMSDLIFLKVDDVKHVNTIDEAIALLGRGRFALHRRAS